MPGNRLEVARKEEVVITRRMTKAIVSFPDGRNGPVHIEFGEPLADWTDDEILEAYNTMVEAAKARAAAYEHCAIEIPPGKPQIRYFPEADQWVPRGGVLRCLIEDGGPDGEAQVEIDDQCLSLAEFGRLLTTYAGWGMRILFVPEDRIHETPPLAVREPEEE